MIPSKNRFHRRNHVNRVYKQGKQVRGRTFSLRFIIDEQRPQQKFAVVVSKKVSKKAVVRNRIRRRVFEVIRHNTAKLPDGFQAIITVFEESAATMEHAELQHQLHSLFKKAINPKHNQ